MSKTNNMKTAEVLTKSYFLFPWEITAPKKDRRIDQRIRQCAEDATAITKNKVTAPIVDDMRALFESDKTICFFVHHSQMMFEPVFCILCDVATPEQYSLLQETVLAVSEKFWSRSFEDKELEKNFLELLYSKENTERLMAHNLRIHEISNYYY